jgi:RecA-family ATPase
MTAEAQQLNESQCKLLGALTLQEVGQIAARKRAWLVEDFIPHKSIGILAAEWGCGKSPFSAQLALTLAAGGRKFLNRYRVPDGPTSVLFLDYESGAETFKTLGNQIVRFLGLAEAPKNFRAHSPNYSCRPDDYTSRSESEYLKRLVRECGFGFVIVDPLRGFDPLAEEKNSYAVNTINQFRRLGVSVLFVHHPSKPRQGEDYSLDLDPHQWMHSVCGASALTANVDFRIGLQEQDDGTLMLRNFVRGRGWGPVEYLVRELDENDQPLG